MNDTRIITLQPDAWHSYRRLRLQALETEPLAFAASLTENIQKPENYWRNRLVDARDGNGAWLYFAERAGSIIGMIGALVKDDPSTAEVIALFVTPLARRAGVGHALLAHLLQQLSQTPGLTRAGLRVNERQDAAIQLYRQFSFRVVDREMEDNGITEPQTRLVMQRDLPAISRTDSPALG